jgi:HEAT repeat protein
MWEPALLVVVSGAWLWFFVRERRERLRVWRAAATACGVQVEESPGSASLRGRAGPLWVTIEHAGGKPPRTRIGVAVPGPPGFYHVKIRPQSLIPLPWMRGLETGDPEFDSTFFIEGPTRLMYSLLSAEARSLLFRVNAEHQVELSDGLLQALIPLEKVAGALPLLLAVGHRFAQTQADPRCLAENARNDPQKEVRLRNLLLLTLEHRGTPVTLEALRNACSDPSPDIRLRAAMELGAEGRDTLLGLAESPVDDESSAQAVRILDRDLPLDRAEAILLSALRRRLIQTASACLETLAVNGAAAAVDTLTKVMALERGELAAAAALALGATGSADAEPPLLEALAREPLDLRLAAATALARVGSVTAVLPLKEAADGLPSPSELRRAARQAIAEIQSRLQGALPGQLSLAGHDAGQLSLAEADAGKLSLAAEQSGELSLMGPHLPGPPLPEEGEGSKFYLRFLPPRLHSGSQCGCTLIWASALLQARLFAGISSPESTSTKANE